MGRPPPSSLLNPTPSIAHIKERQGDQNIRADQLHAQQPVARAVCRSRIGVGDGEEENEGRNGVEGERVRAAQGPDGIVFFLG